MAVENIQPFPCDTCGKKIWGGWLAPGGFGKPNPVQCGACCNPPREEKPPPQTRPAWNAWLKPHTMYCTVIPCRDCALRIIQNGWIKKVFYAEWYESRNSKDTEALFATRDEDTIKVMTDRFGPPGETGWVPTPRVELVKMDFTPPIENY